MDMSDSDADGDKVKVFHRVALPYVTDRSDCEIYLKSHFTSITNGELDYRYEMNSIFSY